MNPRSLNFLKTPIDSIVLISMQNDGHRDSTVFHPCGNRLIQADREAADTDRVAPGADTRFTIFPVSESTQVHNLFVGSLSDFVC
jgi:predicted Holliday junction resolvase-like endonuclease